MSRTMQTVYGYLYNYEKYLSEAWHSITPVQYGYLLVSVAAVGWLMMKSGAR